MYKKRWQDSSVNFDLQRYQEYLRSELWADRRRRVMQRDGDICQSCGVAVATQVHHLTYRHVYEEPLFDLVAICDECHEMVTRRDRANKARGIRHY